MARRLDITLGQCSERGRRATNQDFHGAVIPEGFDRDLKGIALAVADGISSSPVSAVAAETAVKSFLSDYYCTPETWAVQTAAERVIRATNSWLYGETRRCGAGLDLDRGYACTLALVILKAHTAHLFHIGDTRILRVAGSTMEPLTEDHRVILQGTAYLGRALGVGPEVAIDYRSVPLAEGDLLVVCTDGVYEHVAPKLMAEIIQAQLGDLQAAANRLVATALQNGSEDNLTVQIVRVATLPDLDQRHWSGEPADLLLPPILEPPAEFAGYQLLRRLHANNRSHIYLARDTQSGEQVAVKFPAMELREDPELLRRFMMEEWVARRVDSPHLLKAAPLIRPRQHLFVVSEYLDGITLRQWMHDHPQPDLEDVRRIIEQVVAGARAMHRKQMVHADLRPENIMIDRNGLAKIIDFGATRVAGVMEALPGAADEDMLGAVQYAAPERLAGQTSTPRSDQFSIGVIAYEMLTGRLPYGAQAVRVRSVAAARALNYISASTGKRSVPAWIDGALRTAVHPDPSRRYEALSEFVQDLRVPNIRFSQTRFTPLVERDPVRFWQGVSVALAFLVFVLLARLIG
jgi:serine/threonine protein phosphatase PrpC